VREAEKHLKKADPVMAKLIRKHGPCPIAESKTGTLFHMLSTAIIAQQLSVKAAATIEGRVMKLCSNPLTPKSIDAVSDDQLREAGLSRSKAAYIRNIAKACENGLSKRKLQNMDDTEAIKALVAVKGIGQWTAEMYLIFGLKRPDILSLGDAGLQRAARNLYNKEKTKDGLLEKVAERWRPYRSVASWYLWKSTG
jgi:DNA-3-methyladenine glycosylase II